MQYIIYSRKFSLSFASSVCENLNSKNLYHEQYPIQIRVHKQVIAKIRNVKISWNRI